MERSDNVVVIGSGRVAAAMCEWISETAGYNLISVVARNRELGEEISRKYSCKFESDFRLIAKADIYIIAVSDSAIKNVASQIIVGDALVVHTSGSAGIEAITSKNRGVLYPLQTFSRGAKLHYKDIPLFIEASNRQTFKALERLASAMSTNAQPCDSELRSKLHLAAVFSCNFVNHLYTIGEQIMRENGLDFSLLKPLIGETTRKVLENCSPNEQQTGPAARNDKNTIEKHLSMLDYNTKLKKIYKILTESIIDSKNG